MSLPANATIAAVVNDSGRDGSAAAAAAAADAATTASTVATTLIGSEADGEQVKQAVYDFAVPLLVLACVISTVFNLLVLVSLRWLRRAINPTLSLSLSLTFADAYASFMLGLGFVVNSYLPLKNLGIGQCFNLVLEALRLSGLVAAALNLLALSFNHYLGILRPLHYASTVTRRSAYIGIILLWAVPLMLFFTYFSSVPGQGFQSTECQVIAFLRQSRFSALLGMIFTVPLIVMMLIYMHIFFIIRQHKIGLFGQGAVTTMTTAQGRHVVCKKTSSNSSVTTSLTSATCTQASRRLQNVKAVYTTLLIIGTYLIGWMPAVFFYVFTCTDSCPFPITEISYRTRISVGILVNALIVLKSLVDPFIYAARMPEVSEALYRMFRCRPRTSFRHVRGPSYNRHGSNHLNNYNFNHSAPYCPKSPPGILVRGGSQQADCTLTGSRTVYDRPEGNLPGSQRVANSLPREDQSPSASASVNNGLNNNGSISRRQLHAAAATTATAVTVTASVTAANPHKSSSPVAAHTATDNVTTIADDTNRCESKNCVVVVAPITATASANVNDTTSDSSLCKNNTNSQNNVTYDDDNGNNKSNCYLNDSDAINRGLENPNKCRWFRNSCEQLEDHHDGSCHQHRLAYNAF
ncbi:alpha-1D adrenergic receptor-like [Varroa jacobsoni]|uniref:alpha-1D adrenergic receptor-like n=1 Tax=Varroa jacobsoni TaxID=62625 RepID=UPI000BF3322B|nr:alpha-1D adrenergic receptor-like [Varroa jacobsoni]